MGYKSVHTHTHTHTHNSPELLLNPSVSTVSFNVTAASAEQHIDFYSLSASAEQHIDFYSLFYTANI